jgi:hypothetical protein
VICFMEDFKEMAVNELVYANLNVK